ncbi:MAG: signal recognition particle protein [Chloroflexi bacterium GWB2_49_20]|nr:MAG: signal recognition particle protein [Chloroflexi bacterium GWB2_49_20]OGN78439.1 MAG: signal recognition particle protein [Chloroflexi bacterium GWC2_49_37]OGN84098.1 MAG: signal recognition particle protein [Chloroflexi bacterium GWD2_49_16]HBG75255.1 signal recognition particle protein [Anaerolineae bacterium]HCC79110.1 signal recognition particle protein [Anaerolineae bacterium]
MFETLTGRLNQVFNQLRRRGKLSTEDVDAALREVRLALLEADVHYSVVKDFVTRVRERSIGHEVSKALNPGQQIIKIVNEELIATLGQPEGLNLTGPRPRIILLVGLQGSGKTTAAGKLAYLLRSKGERVILVAGDPYRPAAIQQLQILGKSLDVPVISDPGLKPPELARHAYEKAKNGGFSVMIIDTAGRSQLDNALMDELRAIVKKVEPSEILLVVDAMVGQEALHIAEGFRDTISPTGLILTKMDGDARGGAAISIRSVTGVPIKFIGTGEKLEALEVYNPERLASRILGMGDVLGLIERAELAYDEDTVRDQTKKLSTGEFSFEDLAEMMRSAKKMGPMSQVMEMLPGGLGQRALNISPDDVEKQVKRTEAIISSMTVQERRHPDILNANRRRRIARGSGTNVQEINRLMKQYQEMRRLFKTMKKTGGRGLSRLFG